MKKIQYLLFILLMSVVMSACSAQTEATSVEPVAESSVVEVATAVVEPVAESSVVEVATAVIEPTVAMSPEELADAMFAAAREDDTEAVAAYLDAGADVQAQMDSGHTVIEIATARGNLDLVKILLATDAEFDEDLFYNAVAASADDVTLIQAFLDAGADVNTVQSGIPNHSVLMAAAEAGDVEVGRFLLDAGADIDQLDPYGDPALNIAAFYGQLDFAKMLLEAGATLDFVGYGSRNALQHAQLQGHDEMAEYLQSIGLTDE